MLRKESCSGEIDDLAHARTEDCLSDCLTKQNIEADALTKAVETGILNDIDTHPSFRELLKHRAYMHQWIAMHVPQAAVVACFMGTPLHQMAGAEQIEDLVLMTFCVAMLPNLFLEKIAYNKKYECQIWNKVQYKII